MLKALPKKCGNNQGRIGPHPAKSLEKNVGWNQQYDARQHQSGQRNAKKKISSPKFKASKTIGHNSGRKDDTNG